ncbi:MAG: tetratricopeptide repeat protein [Longimicrobiales bacterium]
MRKSAAPRGPSKKKDVDSAARARLLRVLSWSFTGATMGGMAGYVGLLYERWGVGMVWALGLGGMLLSLVAPVVVAALSGAAARTLYNPSGSGMPRRRELSQAEALAARGLHDEAIAAFRVAIAEDPTDPSPYIKVARIERDRRGRHEEAATWFKSAFDLMAPGSGPALLTLKELVELYAVKLGAPARAAPLLARLVADRPETPEGKWAREELARVKGGMR